MIFNMAFSNIDNTSRLTCFNGENEPFVVDYDKDKVNHAIEFYEGRGYECSVTLGVEND